MKSLRHSIYLLLASIHFALIILYNLHSILSEHGQYPLERFVRIVNGIPLIRQYLIWSGTETVYGFFAPSVGSQHILLLYTNDKNEVVSYPIFSSKKGRFRYVSFLAQLDDRLRDTDTLLQSYGKALLKGLVKQYEKRPDAKQIKLLELYVAIQATLAEPLARLRYKRIYHLSL
ncbi:MULTISPECIES: hypothetical protein [Olivibacter]|uniref:Uncharacterized protein n=1 Tax=Olivibacter jilunii TaxID=985016 RepID=A0ABW6B7J2_9SPHI|nr:hypothetical protein [Pseudosphingobacterium sp.]